MGSIVASTLLEEGAYWKKTTMQDDSTRSTEHPSTLGKLKEERDIAKLAQQQLGRGAIVLGITMGNWEDHAATKQL